MSQNATELYNLGYYHYTGTEGYPLNKHTAIMYFQQAAELGNSEAMNYLGLIYEEGEFVQKDIKAAASWFYKALSADSNNIHAMYNIGRMYYNGAIGPKDTSKAFQYFKAASLTYKDNPHPQACYMAGVMLLNDFGRLREAWTYFNKAANYGNIPAAWHNLGWLAYYKGIYPSNGAAENSKLSIAVQYYTTAANLGYVDSMHALACILIQNKHEAEGEKWLSRAIAMGHEPSKKFLKAYKISKGGSLWELFKKY